MLFSRWVDFSSVVNGGEREGERERQGSEEEEEEERWRASCLPSMRTCQQSTFSASPSTPMHAALSALKCHRVAAQTKTKTTRTILYPKSASHGSLLLPLPPTDLLVRLVSVDLHTFGPDALTAVRLIEHQAAAATAAAAAATATTAGHGVEVRPQLVEQVPAPVLTGTAVPGECVGHGTADLRLGLEGLLHPNLSSKSSLTPIYIHCMSLWMKAAC